MINKITCVVHQDRNQRGFTLVEMSVVLIVIGIIIGAVSIGKDVQRNAVYQQISTAFMQSWSTAYQAHFTSVGVVVGDSQTTPTSYVGGAIGGGSAGTALRNAMLAAGVRLPAGRAEGSEDRFVYLDSNGNPQEVQASFLNVPWAEEATTTGTFVLRDRNVLVLSNLTPDLARLLDTHVDGKPDARFGLFRENSQAAGVGVTAVGVTTAQPSAIWSVDNRSGFGTTTAATLDEDQVAVVVGYYRMSR